MLLEKIESVLNEQIALESYASQNYLAMASWCDVESLEGCAEFLYRQSEEERLHMMKLLHYINESDGKAIVPAIKQPPARYDNVQDLFQTVYEHEKKVTAAINEIVALCYDLRDHATLNFIQWYVEEQREEEALMRTILDRIKLIGNGPQSLYYIDKELKAINSAAAEAAAAEQGEE